MCYFIALGVPATADSRLLDEFGRGFMLLPTSSASICRALPSAFKARLLTSGMCSCDLYVKPGIQPPETPTEELRTRYRKRGWSEVKIDRAVSQATAKSEIVQPAFSGLRADVAAGVVAVAQSEGSIALVVHWFSGDVETEGFAVSPGPRLRGADFYAAAESLPADTLVWVDAAKGATGRTRPVSSGTEHWSSTTSGTQRRR